MVSQDFPAFYPVAAREDEMVTIRGLGETAPCKPGSIHLGLK